MSEVIPKQQAVGWVSMLRAPLPEPLTGKSTGHDQLGMSNPGQGEELCSASKREIERQGN